MKFNELAWAGFCFYYRSAGDKRYSIKALVSTMGKLAKFFIIVLKTLNLINTKVYINKTYLFKSCHILPISNHNSLNENALTSS